MPGRSGPLMDTNLSVTGLMAERCQSLVDDMIWRETNLGDRKRPLKQRTSWPGKHQPGCLWPTSISTGKLIPKALSASC